MTTNRGSSALAWPGNLSRGAVRWSFRSLHYDTTIAFYRDLVRLSVLAEFSSSFGEDGTILGLPGTSVHLEILRARSGDTGAVGHEEIVLYLDGDEAVHSATAGLRKAGMTSDREGHAYWKANGAITYRDPDGRGLVFAPWVFGQVPDPVDRPAAGTDPADPDPAGAFDASVRIDWYGGERHDLLALFEEAEDSAMRLEAYIGDGRVLVARVGDDIVGHLQLVEGSDPGDLELKSMAVVADRRGAGIGTRLVEHAITAIARQRLPLDARCDRGCRNRQPAVLPTPRLPCERRRAGRLQCRRRICRGNHRRRHPAAGSRLVRPADVTEGRRR